MKKLNIFLGACAIIFSAASHAAIIEVIYEGVINSNNYTGDGAGYSIGDSISGAMFIDTNLAPPPEVLTADEVSYYNNGSDNSGFVTGYSGVGNPKESYDWVYIADNYYSQPDDSYQDWFLVSDFERVNGTSEYLDIEIWDWIAGTDFINGLSLFQNFELYDTDNLAQFWGHIHNGTGNAEIDLTYLAVNPVPVPAAVWLFGSGFIGLIGVARRKKS